MKALFTYYVSGLCFIAFFPMPVHAETNQPSQASEERPVYPAIQHGQIFSGKVIDVASGETFTMVTPENREIEVWLAEIEAPEKGQVYWNDSRQALSKKVLGKDVTIQVVSIKDLEDGYDYVIAQTYMVNRWINREMVAEGWAWHFPQYYQSQELAMAEQQARTGKLGLWAVANLEMPWEYQPPLPVVPAENQIQPLLKMEW